MKIDLSSLSSAENQKLIGPLVTPALVAGEIGLFGESQIHVKPYLPSGNLALATLDVSVSI